MQSVGFQQKSIQERLTMKIDKPIPINPSTNSIDLAHPKYRPDIDGLRAIAVLLVVGYHAFPQVIRGGFIGVDIFFVISGYLISTIIFQSPDNKGFSFSTFYARRIKRIFPSLLLVLIFCYLVGWNFLFQSEFKQLNKHIAAGTAFVYNFLSWSESGYFDSTADRKPLLHLWSLGIEEQFYIFWPLIVYLARRLRVSFVFSIFSIFCIFFFSFALNLWYLNTDVVAAFYSPFSRFWELLIGSILAYIKLSNRLLPNIYFFRSDNLRSSIGIALIIIGIFMIDNDRMFPGWWALLPTVGTVLIISAGSLAWPNRMVLSSPMLVWFGLISFPLYLWHWPLLSFLHIATRDGAPLLARFAIILASILLAWLTYVIIEKPIRSMIFNRGTVDVPLLLLLLLMIFVGMAAFVSYGREKGEGLPRTFRDLNPLSASGFDGGDPGFTINDCGVTNPTEKALLPTCFRDSRDSPKFALIGDSKALALYPGLLRTSSANGRWLVIGGNGSNGAPIPIISDALRYSHFQKVAKIAVANIAVNTDIKIVVIVTAMRSIFSLRENYTIEGLPEITDANYNETLLGLKSVVDRFTSSGKEVVIVVDNPTLQDPNLCMARNTRFILLDAFLAKKDINKYCEISLDRHIFLTAKYRRLLTDIQGANPKQVRLFETMKYYCSADRICSISKDDRLLYSYTDHISDYASGLIGGKLNEFLLTSTAELSSTAH